MNLTADLATHLLAPLILLAGVAAPFTAAAQRSPGVDVWFDGGNEFDRGGPGRVMYSGDAGSYVTLLRVDTDGRLTVLSPRNPNDRSRYVGTRDGAAVPFLADPTEGVGYVFAIASRTPFDFRNYRGRGNSWNTGTLGERGMVDPFEIVDRFARSSVGSRGAYSIAYAPYEIGRGGMGRASYQRGVRYDDAYGDYADGYSDPWGASPYRRGYDDYRFYAGHDTRGYGYGGSGRYNSDPRTRALRHCPDGTLAPYTTPCSAFERPRNSRRNGGEGRDALRPMQPMQPRTTPGGRERP
jgi:hypothetical protein